MNFFTKPVRVSFLIAVQLFSATTLTASEQAPNDEQEVQSQVLELFKTHNLHPSDRSGYIDKAPVFIHRTEEGKERIFLSDGSFVDAEYNFLIKTAKGWPIFKLVDAVKAARTAFKDGGCVAYEEKLRKTLALNNDYFETMVVIPEAERVTIFKDKWNEKSKETWAKGMRKFFGGTK